MIVFPHLTVLLALIYIQRQLKAGCNKRCIKLTDDFSNDTKQIYSKENLFMQIENVLPNIECMSSEL